MTTHWIRLVTGEEIVAEITSEHETFIRVVEPTYVSSIGGETMILAPYGLGLATAEFPIYRHSIIFHAPVSEPIEKLYAISKTIRKRSAMFFDDLVATAYTMIERTITDREPTEQELKDIEAVEELEKTDSRPYTEMVDNLINLAERAGKGKNGTGKKNDGSSEEG